MPKYIWALYPILDTFWKISRSDEFGSFFGLLRWDRDSNTLLLSTKKPTFRTTWNLTYKGPINILTPLEPALCAYLVSSLLGKSHLLWPIIHMEGGNNEFLTFWKFWATLPGHIDQALSKYFWSIIMKHPVLKFDHQ